MLKGIFTKKRIIIGVVVLLVVLVIYNKATAKPAGKVYETAAVSRGNLIQSVEATGKITSETDIDLRFELPGVISAVLVKEGQVVKKGTLLSYLRLSELNAQVAQAKANLDLKIAGLNDGDRQYYKSAVDSAQVAYNDAIGSAGRSYDGLLNSYKSGIPKLDDALTQADNILAIDNPLANETFAQQLSGRDRTKLTYAKSRYSVAKSAKQTFETKVAVLSSPDRDGLDATKKLADTAIDEMETLLNAVAEALRYTSAQGDLTQASLDAKKTTIENTRTTIATYQAALAADYQAMITAENAVQSKLAALDQAEANYDSKVMPPREVDLASLRAALAAALAAREKAMLRAPVEGVITKLNKKVGESVSTADAVIKLTSPHYEIKVDVPEMDVPKLKLKDQAVITLDALGNDTKLTGMVTSIQPSATEIQDVVYYKVTISLNENETRIKPGMTANIVVTTATRENVLYVPTRSIRSDEEGNKYVRVLNGGQEVETKVRLGLKANEGRTEVLSGLGEGDSVIVSIKENK